MSVRDEDALTRMRLLLIVLLFSPVLSFESANRTFREYEYLLYEKLFNKYLVQVGPINVLRKPVLLCFIL